MVVSLGPIFFKGTATHNLNEDFGPICLLENSFFLKENFRKVNYFPMFGSVMKNKLENTFQLVEK